MKAIAFIFSILFLTNFGTIAQNGQVTVEGKFQEGAILTKKERKKLFVSPANITNVQVNITENGHVKGSYFTENESKYQIFLQPDMVYSIEFKKEGYISKLISINTYGMETEFIMKGYELYTDITLFKNLENVNTSAYAKLPVARCTFNKKKNTLIWDMAYSQNAFETFIYLTEENKKMTPKEKTDKVLNYPVNHSEEMETVDLLEAQMNLIIAARALEYSEAE